MPQGVHHLGRFRLHLHPDRTVLQTDFDRHVTERGRRELYLQDSERPLRGCSRVCSRRGRSTARRAHPPTAHGIPELAFNPVKDAGRVCHDGVVHLLLQHANVDVLVELRLPSFVCLVRRIGSDVLESTPQAFRTLPLTFAMMLARVRCLHTRRCVALRDRRCGKLRGQLSYRTIGISFRAFGRAGLSALSLGRVSFGTV